MPKTNIPNYRQHKATGQAFVELGGRRFYLGKHGSKASKEEYERKIAEYLGNGRKLAPTQVKTGITCRELAVHFLEWAEKYYIKNGEQTKSFNFAQKAVSLFVKHYGKESTNNFGPLSLVFLQDKWVEQGLGRKTVNKSVRVIRQAFKYGKKFGWVSAETYLALQEVDNLKKGHTKAHEYRKIKPVALAVVEKTLPFMPPVIDDMVRVQLLCAMRPQDVCNMRLIDIDRSKEVWRYEPYTHKNEDKDKERIIAIGPKTQAILAAYLFEKEETPEAFLFSPKDSVLLQKIEKRRKRKTFNKQGQVQPSQRNRSRPNTQKPGDKYTTDSYRRAVSRACKEAGTTATITGLSENTEYEFQVRASNNDRNSNWSESVFVVTDCISTSQKRRRVFRCTGKTTDSVTLAWNAASKAARYEVQYRQSGTTTWTNVSVSQVPHWTVNQLRHTMGTEVRNKYGLDAAQVYLGHANASTTEIYAELDFAKAERVAKEIG